MSNRISLGAGRTLSRVPELAADLVRRRVAVIAAPGSAVATARGESGEHDNSESSSAPASDPGRSLA